MRPGALPGGQYLTWHVWLSAAQVTSLGACRFRSDIFEVETLQVQKKENQNKTGKHQPNTQTKTPQNNTRPREGDLQPGS